MALGSGLLVSISPGGVIIVIMGLSFLLVVWKKVELIVYLWMCSPVLYAYRVEVGSVPLNLYRALFVLLVLTLPFRSFGPGSFFQKGRRHHLRVYIRTMLCLLLLFVVFALGWIRTQPQFMSFATSRLVNVSFALGTLFYLLHFVNGEERLRGIVKAYLVSSTFLAGYGVYEGLSWFVTGVRPSLPFSQFAVSEVAYKLSVVGDLGLPRVESFVHDANHLGLQLVIAVLFLMSYLREKSRPRFRYILIFAILVDVACIILTVSRSAILSLGIGLLLLQFKRYGVSGNRWVRGAMVGTVVILLFVVLYFTVPIISTYTDGILFRLLGKGTTGSGIGRIAHAKEGLEAFLSSPIMGIGMGNPIPSKAGGYMTHTHSFYLTILVRYGVVGMLIVGAFLWPLIREAVKTVLFSRGKGLALGFSIGALALLGFQIIYNALFSETIWPTFSILYIWALLHEQKHKRGRQSVKTLSVLR